MSARAVAVIGVRDGELAVGAVEAVAEVLDAAGTPEAAEVLVIGSGTETGVEHLHAHGLADVPTRLGEIAGFQPARIAHAVAEFVEDVPIVVLPASNDGRDLGPRLAHLLGRPFHGGATRVTPGCVTTVRAGGSALVEITVDGGVVATLQPGVRALSARMPGAPRTPTPIPAFAVFSDVADVEVLEVLPPEASTMDLADASFIVGAGAGLGDAEHFGELVTVAAHLGASVGATRVVTDAGWTGHDRQIGTTGVVVDPRVYVAFGISGAVQHTSGLGSPDHVISVNTDEHCPMMHLADLAVVADAPAVVAALGRLLADPSGDDGSSAGTETQP